MSLDLLQVIGLIIEFSTLPQLPDDAQPTVSQAAVGVALGVTSGQAAAQVSRSPLGLPHRGFGKLLRCPAIIAVAATAEAHMPLLAALDGDGAGTSQGSNGLWSRVALSMVAKHDQQLGSQ